MDKIKLLGLVFMWLGACTAESNLTPTTYNVEPVLTAMNMAGVTPAPSPSNTSIPTIQLTPPEEFPVVKLLSQGERLENPGPWLIVNVDDGLLFISQDGIEQGFLPNPPPEYTYATATPAPKGGLVAIVYDQSYEAERILKIYSLLEGRFLYSQDLLEHAAEPPDKLEFSQQYAYEEDRRGAVGEVAWSSDGKKLAFVSSHLGPSPDVYLYDVETGSVMQLTSEPSHATNLSWSPDDKYIFHAGVEKMYYGASGYGYQGWRFYAARADGSGVLFAGKGLNDEHRGEEAVLGWISNNTVLIESNFPCEKSVLRSINIETGTQWHLGPDHYLWFEQSLFDPINEYTLAWEYKKLCSYEIEPIGLYKYSALDGSREEIVISGEISGLPEDWYRDTERFDVRSMAWSHNGGHFAVEIVKLATYKHTWVTITSQGEIQAYKGQPVFAPDGEIYALIDYGVDLVEIHSPDGEVHSVDHGGINVEYPLWSPDGTYFYFIYQKDYESPYLLYSWNIYLEAQSVSIPVGDYFKEPVWLIP